MSLLSPGGNLLSVTWHRRASESKGMIGDMSATANLGRVTANEWEIGPLPITN